MAEPETFEKTPKKASRWFRAFIVLTLLYGITFSLDSFFNWIFFWAALYCFFMSYFTLPVQPKVFQGRPKQQFNYGSRAGQAQTQSGQGGADVPAARGRKTVILVVSILLGVFVGIPFIVGLIEGFTEESSTTTDTEEQSTSSEEATTGMALVDIGNDFFNQQQYDSADKYYDRALADDADNMAAVYGKGIVLYQRDRRDEANAWFLRAHEGGYRYAWLSWVLADTYDKQGQSVKAVNFYKESVNLDSTYTDSYKRLAELEPANSAKWLELAQKYKTD